ncbi:MAG: bacteriohemerythrin [Gammaproteobacteria bacterium]|nr:bacteriohemerythrin [Gammaproteobacteria bacterium]MBU1777532.1 bacteriohemerythrin [Gammaproteobacteria bacterium]MBU1969612.1 bacteriohemerythrin [Gammaproteobacteria bacterium]
MDSKTFPADIFPWNENFQTGISVIDAQHRKLVELLNKLASHLAYGEEKPELNMIFNELTDYAQYHFKTEEGIWNKYLATDKLAVDHAGTHHSFVDEVIKLRGKQETFATEQMIEEIVVFLTHWLAFHILESDKHMAKIVLSVQLGLTLDEAKDKARKEMSGALRVLIETILSMYDTLSSRTLQLMREVAERQRAEDKLRLSRKVIDSTLEAIFITDQDGMIIDTNPSFCLDVQLEHAQIVGRDVRQLKPSLFSQDKSDEIWRTATESGHWAGETVGRDAGGEIEGAWLALSSIKDSHGVITHYVGVISSITHLVKRQQILEVEANHDALTGLPNRRLLQDRLDQAITHSDRAGRVMALCYLDLDGFKQINDTLGHDAGDDVLRLVAARLGKALRGEDTVVRLGGDEFVLLLGDLDSEESAVQFLNRLLKDISQPMSIFGNSAEVTASIGVTFYPRDQSAPEQLLKHADEAMLTAKREGKSRYHFYS